MNEAPKQIMVSWAAKGKAVASTPVSAGIVSSIPATEYVRRDLAQAPAPVRVKPLQFRDETGDGVLTSRETGELFRIFPQADGMFFAPKLEDGSAPDAQTLIDRLNARHTARILAALEAPDAAPTSLQKVQPTPDAGAVAELVEAWDAARSHEGVKVSLRGEASRASWDAFLAAMDKARAVLAKMEVR